MGNRAVQDGVTVLAQRKKATDWNKVGFIAVCIIPAFVILATFLYYPIVETFRYSLNKSDAINADVFVGFDNYIYLFGNENFLAGLLHVFQWAFFSIVLQLPLAFLVAFALTFYVNKFTGPLRVIFFLSNILPSAIVAMLGNFIFNNSGVIVTIANSFGWEWLSSIDWLGDPNLAFWSIFTIGTWTYTGFYIVYFMACIEQIPKEMKEAAELDGAVGWRYARKMVIPQMIYPMQLMAVMSVAGSFRLFDLPWLMTSGGPGNATTTLGIIVYQEGFINGQYGMASAVGVVIFLLSLVFTIITFSTNMKESEAK